MLKPRFCVSLSTGVHLSQQNTVYERARESSNCHACCACAAGTAQKRLGAAAAKVQQLLLQVL